MSPTLFTQTYASYLALGVGELGGRAAAAGCLEGFGERLPWAACDCQPARLLATGLERKLLIELPEQARPEVAAQLVAAHKEELAALAERRVAAVLLGVLGEPGAELLLPALSAALREAGLFVCVIALEPLAPEAAPPSPYTAQVSASLARAADLFLPLSSGAILATLGSGASLVSVYQAAEAVLAGAAQSLLAALAAHDYPVSFTTRALARTLRGAGHAFGAVGLGHGGDAPRVALEDALDARWWPQGLYAGRASVALALVAAREISVGEAAAVAERIKRDREPSAPTLIGLGHEGSLGEEARCLLMLRPAHSRKVLPFP